MLINISGDQDIIFTSDAGVVVMTTEKLFSHWCWQFVERLVARSEQGHVSGASKHGRQLVRQSDAVRNYKQPSGTNARLMHISIYFNQNGATGLPISLQIFRKLHDRITWKLVDFSTIYAEHSH